MEFEIKNPPTEELRSSFIEVEDNDKILIIRIDDVFGDDAVISLREPQRSEFIRKIKELKTND